jgi:hypothetical protein
MVHSMAKTWHRSLTAGDGAQFYALIKQASDGQWRALAVVQTETEQQSSTVESFQTEEAARAWVDRAAIQRGFTSYEPEIMRKP